MARVPPDFRMSPQPPGIQCDGALFGKRYYAGRYDYGEVSTRITRLRCRRASEYSYLPKCTEDDLLVRIILALSLLIGAVFAASVEGIGYGLTKDAAIEQAKRTRSRLGLVPIFLQRPWSLQPL